MMRLPGTALVLAALLACVPRLAWAQISTDSLSLAQAVAARIDSVWGQREPKLLMLPETPFDSAVNLALRGRKGFPASVRDSAHVTRIGTRGMISLRDPAEVHGSLGRRIPGRGVARDSAQTLHVGTTVAVVVEDAGSKPDDGSGLFTWGTRYALLFTRTVNGWSYAGGRELSTWDGGVIRDDPEPGVPIRKDAP